MKSLMYIGIIQTKIINIMANITPNTVKYTVTDEDDTIRSGNYLLGVNDVNYGQTGTSDHWNGISPGATGYTLYFKRTGTEPSIMQFSSDAAIINYANDVLGASVSTIEAAFTYFVTELNFLLVINSFLKMLKE